MKTDGRGSICSSALQATRLSLKQLLRSGHPWPSHPCSSRNGPCDGLLVFPPTTHSSYEEALMPSVMGFESAASGR